MAEQSNTGAQTAVVVMIGIGLGMLFTYIILNSKATQASSTLQLQAPQPPPPTNPFQPQHLDMDVFKQMLTEIQNMNKLMQSLSEENSQLRAQLGTCREVKPMAATMHEASKVQAPLTTTSTYKNNEKRVYERGKDGFIKSITIVRDAKVNAV